MTDTEKLLAEYVRQNSDAAFGELVSRYLNLVYSTAFRLVSNDAHFAQDVTQTVFTDLARMAHALSPNVMLGGWLHRHTCFVASKTMRAERRRRTRETEASAMHSQQDHSAANFAEIAPVLDEAINQLGAEDRAAITLRFFERRDLRSVGAAVGTTEEAARKRVNRALEKLQILLKRRGIALSATALGATLSSSAVTAAPPGLSAGIASAALTSASAASASTFAVTLTQILPMTKLQASLVGAVLVAGVATTLVIERNAAARGREFADTLQKKEAQLQELQSVNQRLLATARAPAAAPVSSGDANEIFRLRGEVARLREDARELARLKAAGDQSQPLEGTLKLWAARVTQLQHSLELMPEKKIPELQLLTDTDWLDAVKGDRDLSSDEGVRRALGSLRNAAKSKLGNLMRDALKKYTAANNNQLPPNFGALKPYFQEPIDESILQRYALTQSGSLADVHPRKSILVAEQAAPADPEHDMNFQFTLDGIRAASVGAGKQIVDFLSYGDEDDPAPGEGVYSVSEVSVRAPSDNAPKN